jgi:hypothetical protein
MTRRVSKCGDRRGNAATEMAAACSPASSRACRRSGLQPDNPVKRLIQQWIGLGCVGRLGHDSLLITLLAKPQPLDRVERLAEAAI